MSILDTVSNFINSLEPSSSRAYEQAHPESMPGNAFKQGINSATSAPGSEAGSIGNIMNTFLSNLGSGKVGADITRAFTPNVSPQAGDLRANAQPINQAISHALGIQPNTPAWNIAQGVGNLSYAMNPMPNLFRVLDQEQTDIPPIFPASESNGHIPESMINSAVYMAQLPGYMARTNNVLPVGGEATRNVALSVLQNYLAHWFSNLVSPTAAQSGGGPTQMNIIPTAEEAARSAGTNLNGGSLPSVMYQPTPSVTNPYGFVDLTNQFAQRAAQVANPIVQKGLDGVPNLFNMTKGLQ